MHGNLSTESNWAIPATDKAAGISVQSCGKSVSDENWFAEMAQKLLAKPGLELHLISQLDERSCHRYAAGTVKPPAYFLRQLLRSERGGAFLSALMAGINPAWWREIEEGRAAIATLARIREELLPD